MLDNDRPIVALTLRHDRFDNFWFALLHELVHVARHLTPESLRVHRRLGSAAILEKVEAEADAMAGEALIPEKNVGVPPKYGQRLQLRRRDRFRR
jgi:HTH-type transcriptional regulator/antitoxin HigA